MRIALVAVGTRQPGWVNSAFEAYRKRLPAHVRLDLEEIPMAPRRGTGDVAAAVAREGEQQLRRADSMDRVIALDERGREWSTTDLASELRDWQQQAPRIALLVGGPDGLAPACMDAAHQTWSLSRLTLPHGLVRVIVAEQIYRATTILQGHPYHRS